MPDLVLLPGWGMPPAVFDGLLPTLSADWQVHVLRLPDADTLPAMAAALLAVAPPRAAWAGWSLGGMVAVQAAADAPERVSALVTVGTNACFTASAEWRYAMPPPVFEGFARAVDEDVEAALSRFCALVTRGGQGAGEELRRLRALLGLAGESPATSRAASPMAERHGAVLRRQLAVLRDADLRAVAPAVACPQQWLLGERDALVPAPVSADLARLLPAARIEILPGASHAGFLSDPAPLLSALAHCLEHA